MTTRALYVLKASLLVSVACGPEEEAPVVETVNLNLEIANGVSLNGTSFAFAPIEKVDTEFLQANIEIQTEFPVWTPQLGGDMPGGEIDPYAGIGVNGQTYGGADLEHLRGIRLDAHMTLADLIGAQVEGETTDGEVTLLSISGAAVGTGSNRDLLYFVVHAAEQSGWVPLCGTDDHGEAIPALAVPGSWDHAAGHVNGGKWRGDARSFTFACRGSSIAKCMEAGYKPWVDPASTGGNGRNRSKADIHKPNHLQACVRMIRADYCGDGVSHTVNGRAIEFWDTMGLHRREAHHFEFEAAWTPDGITMADYPRVFDLRKGWPSCFHQAPWGNDKARRGDPGEIERLRLEGNLIFSAYEERLELR